MPVGGARQIGIAHSTQRTKEAEKTAPAAKKAQKTAPRRVGPRQCVSALVRLLQRDARVSASPVASSPAASVLWAPRRHLQCLPRHQRRRGVPIGLPRVGIHGGRWTPGGRQEPGSG